MDLREPIATLWHALAGQRTRAALTLLAVAWGTFAADPPLLLCDEPTGNLDSHAGAEVVALLESLWRDGRTLVVVTHDEGLAARARRRVRMADGRVVGVE